MMNDRLVPSPFLAKLLTVLLAAAVFVATVIALHLWQHR